MRLFYLSAIRQRQIGHENPSGIYYILRKISNNGAKKEKKEQISSPTVQFVSYNNFKMKSAHQIESETHN